MRYPFLQPGGRLGAIRAPWNSDKTTSCRCRPLFLTRFKRKLGQALAEHAGTRGRPNLSGGWGVTPVRNRPHFDRLPTRYLPDHEAHEAGLFRRYERPPR